MLNATTPSRLRHRFSSWFSGSTATFSAAVATLLIAIIGAPVALAQTGPADVAYVWANDESSTVYTPSFAYAYNPAGTIQISRSSVGSYNVVFNGLGSLTDMQLGGLGNVQVSAYGSVAAFCKIVSWGGTTNLDVSVQCYDEDALLADNRFYVQVVLPGSNPVDLGFVYADQQSTANYTAAKGWAYNSAKRDVSITRTSTGIYTVQFNGIPSFSTPTSGSAGHVQVTPVGSSSTICQVTGWGQNAGDLQVGVKCFDGQVVADSRFSLLLLGPESDIGGLGFAWTNDSASSSYTPLGSWAYNEAGGAITASRTGTGVYSIEFANLSTYGGLFAGGSGHLQVTPYGTSPAFCTVSWTSTTTATVRCFVGIGEFHAPVDSRYNVEYVYRQTTPTEQGVVNFDPYADGQIVTTVVGEPVSFPDGIEVEQCSTTGPNCVRAWSGDKVAFGQIGFEFDREPIVMEFSTPQSSVSVHANMFSQNAQTTSVTLTAKNSVGGVIGTTVESLTAAPAWGTVVAYEQPPGSPIIARVEITSTSVTDWVYIDDLLYDNDVILPVELASFNGIVDGNDVVLRWEVLSEKDVSGYTVQRQQGEAWTSISGLVPATSPDGGSYSWRAANAGSGLNRFRLAALDLDGSVRYSDTVELEIASTEAYSVSPVYPNPIAGRATLAVSVGQQQTIRVELFDLLGRSVLVVPDELVEASERREIGIDASNLPSGTYLVRVAGEHFSDTRSIVIAR